MIRVDRLVKSYGPFPALREVSFEIGRGEVVGFLGPNGAGKTTTLRILSGFMPASSGSVRVAGFDVAENSREVRRRCGYLPEEVPLYRDLKVREYLRLLAGLKEVPRERVESEVDRVAALTGLEPVIGRLVGKCSKGYRQRVGLAQALLGGPEVLLLDEPTSGLDPNQVVEVREVIRKLAGERTVLLSSHILAEIEHVCTRVLIIHEGRVVGAGTPEDLSRRLETAEVLLVETSGPVSAERLREIPGVLEVTGGETAGAFRIRAAEPAMVAPEVARRIVAAGGDLLQLRRDRADLEAVFRLLTGGGGHA